MAETIPKHLPARLKTQAISRPSAAGNVPNQNRFFNLLLDSSNCHFFSQGWKTWLKETESASPSLGACFIAETAVSPNLFSNNLL